MLKGLGEYRRTEIQDVLAVKVTTENIVELANWAGAKLVWVGKANSPARIFEGLDVPTLSGTKRATFGDYLVKYTSGAMGIWPKEIFEEKYSLRNLVLDAEEAA